MFCFRSGAALAAFAFLAFSARSEAFTHPLAFVTSTTGTGNLQTWTDAGGNTGLAAADAVCKARATAGGLAQPAQFIAWMSDANDDAYCRLHGLHGKRADLCGQAALPSAAGPWWRVDGKVFAGDAQDAFNDNRILRTLDIDELGHVSTAKSAFTGTSGSGAVVDAALTCKNWTGAGAVVQTINGLLTATAQAWTEGYYQSCSGNLPLYCLQTGVGDPLPAGHTGGRPAFLSNTLTNGNFAANLPIDNGSSGAGAADTICRQDAATLNLPRADTFRAWISEPGIAAASRFGNDGPWYRVDGIRVATTLAQLQSGQLEQPLNLIPGTNFGTYKTSIAVWTGTLSAGGPAAQTCAGWSFNGNGQNGGDGIANHKDGPWTESTELVACDVSHYLYCFADNDTLYTDGFQ